MKSRLKAGITCKLLFYYCMFKYQKEPCQEGTCVSWTQNSTIYYINSLDLSFGRLNPIKPFLRSSLNATRLWSILPPSQSVAARLSVYSYGYVCTPCGKGLPMEPCVYERILRQSHQYSCRCVLTHLLKIYYEVTQSQYYSYFRTARNHAQVRT